MRKTLVLLALVAAGTPGVALAATGSGTNYSTTPSLQAVGDAR